MKLEALLKGIQPLSVTGRKDIEISGVTADSRQVKPGWLFAAVPGTKHDGLSFAVDAIARGAVAIVSESGEQTARHVTHVVVPDAHLAIAFIARNFFGSPALRMKVCGITGTNGKTTTAYLIRSMVEESGRKIGLIGTVEYRLGERIIPASRTTPDPVTLQSFLSQMMNAGCEWAVMEVSSHALVQQRTAGVEFDIAVATNVARDHLDYHVTWDAYFEAKSILFRNLATGGKRPVAVLNADDGPSERFAAFIPQGVEILRYGISKRADVRAENVRIGETGTSFLAVTPWGMGEMTTRLIGRFNVSNILASIAAVGSQGVNINAMARAMLAFTGVPGRLEEIPTQKRFRVFVDYAHTDDALSRVLTALREICKGKLIVTFGCGGDRDRSKRPAMGAVAVSIADRVVITSDNPRTEDPLAIISEILEGCGNSSKVESRPDRFEAIEMCLKMAEPGDIVLIAGKGHESFQELGTRTVPFDDRLVARKILSCLS